MAAKRSLAAMPGEWSKIDQLTFQALQSKSINALFRHGSENGPAQVVRRCLRPRPQRRRRLHHAEGAVHWTKARRQGGERHPSFDAEAAR